MDLTALPAMVALGLLAYHLFRTFAEIGRITQAPPVASSLADARRQELLRRKRRRLEDIKEIEFDYIAGKLDETDRDAFTAELKGRVVALMKEIDALDQVDARGTLIEDELRGRMEQIGA